MKYLANSILQVALIAAVCWAAWAGFDAWAAAFFIVLLFTPVLLGDSDEDEKDESV